MNRKDDKMELRKEEMYEVNGGAVSAGVIAGICAGIIYLVGVLSGYTNPNRCNNR